MSWLARSIANTLRLDDDDVVPFDGVTYSNDVESRVLSRDGNDEAVNCFSSPDPLDLTAGLGTEEREEGGLEKGDLGDRFDDVELNESQIYFDRNTGGSCRNDDSSSNDSNHQGRGVKEDLSELTETLTRQLWGVASFLAPPPPPPPPPPPSSRRVKPDRVELDRDVREDESDRSGSETEEEEEEEVEYVEGDGSYYSDYVEERVEDAVGVTEEALAFAQNIAHHPETWLDFPLSEEEEFEGFQISYAQHKHSLAIEHLAPRLAALRIELCPVHMSEGYFWMVYFVLLHSRLKKHDADLLSTPQLVQARATWREELLKRTKQETDWFGMKNFYSQESTHSPREDSNSNPSEDSHPRYFPHATYVAEPESYPGTTDFETEKNPTEISEVQFLNKSTIDPLGKSEKGLPAGSSANVLLQDYDDDADDWLEETAELEGYTFTGGNEEDVSFSDLEEDSDWTMPVKSK